MAKRFLLVLAIVIILTTVLFTTVPIWSPTRQVEMCTNCTLKFSSLKGGTYVDWWLQHHFWAEGYVKRVYDHGVSGVKVRITWYPGTDTEGPITATAWTDSNGYFHVDKVDNEPAPLDQKIKFEILLDNGPNNGYKSATRGPDLQEECCQKPPINNRRGCWQESNP